MPAFRTGNGIASEDHALLERCRAIVAEVRFDATALPVDSLFFEAREDGVALARSRP